MSYSSVTGEDDSYEYDNYNYDSDVSYDGRTRNYDEEQLKVYRPGGPIDFDHYIAKEMNRLNIKSGVALSFSRVTYTVQQPVVSHQPTFLNNLKGCFQRKERIPYKLLNETSGYVEPGMLVLLLGPPGAGKTTLLEVLAGRKIQKKGQSEMRGEILINGRPWTSDFNRIAGYVTQQDYHIPQMTVRETLLFSSMLRNHSLVSKQKKQERVEVVLDMLGLRHVADTVVGGELLRGVSGGEKKRVSIGVELVKGPGILLLDEPTTGLDSSAAMDVVKSLRSLADAGVPVICSLLQPSQELFDQFDHVMLMNKREVAYFGPTEGVLKHFEEAGYRCPDDKNIAEFLLDICTPKGVEYMIEGAEKDINTFYKTSAANDQVNKALWKGVSPPDPNKSVLPSDQAYATSTLFQTAKCTQRAATNFFRNRRNLITRLMRALIIGLLLGTLFWQMDKYQLGANNRISILFFCITFTAMGSVASIPQVVEERTIFYHQRAAHFYRTIAYFLSSVIMDIPLSFLENIIFTTIVFWMTGMNNTGQSGTYQFMQYFWYFFILFLTNLSAKQWCRLAAAMTPSLSAASSIAPAILCVWLVFAGFLIPRNTIPWIWKPVNVISTFRYTFESLAINEMLNLEVQCKDDQYVPPEPLRDTPYYGGGKACPVTSGEQLLHQYGLNHSATWMYADVGVLAAFYVFFCLATYLCLHFLNFYHITPQPMLKSDLERLIATGSLVESNSSETANEAVRPMEEFQGKTLSFQHTFYSVNMVQGLKGKLPCVDKQPKMLLNDVSGWAEPYKMVALMGASGAGKSTLLDVLAQRKTGGSTSGHVLVDGYFKDKYYNRLVGYVEQSNVFLPTMTVRETLVFSARMRLPSELPMDEKLRRVESVMGALGLGTISERMVGNPNSGGLSPELRKKLSIAAELVSDPAILFLDEPTSGLDSQAALNVMLAARAVCDSGVPVICTIHQPSAELFMMFDNLLLMKKGGFVIYYGPLGQGGQTVLQFFERQGFSCEPRKNPADFVLECSGAGIGGNSAGGGSTSNPALTDGDLEDGLSHVATDPVANWRQAPENAEVETKLNGIVEEAMKRKGKGSGSPTGYRSPYAISLLAQISLSLGRSFKNKFRQPAANRTFILTYVIMGLLLGSLYWQQEEDLVGARNRVALCYFIIVFSALGAIAAIPGLILQREVYYREKPAFLRPFAYFFSTVVSEFPLVILSAVIMGTTLYFMAALYPVGADDAHTIGVRFLNFIGAYTLSAMTCVAFAMAVAASVPSTEIANTMVGVFSTIFSLFAGFIIPSASIPPWWKWVHYIDYYKYALEALSITEMLGRNFKCDPNEEVQIYNPITGETVPYCPVNTGAEFLQSQFTMHTEWKYFGIDLTALFGFLCLFILLCFVGIRFINHLTR